MPPSRSWYPNTYPSPSPNPNPSSSPNPNPSPGPNPNPNSKPNPTHNLNSAPCPYPIPTPTPNQVPGGIDLTPLPGRYLTAPSNTSVASVRLAGTTSALCAAPDWDQLHVGCYAAALFGAPRTTALTLALALALVVALAPALALALVDQP